MEEVEIKNVGGPNGAASEATLKMLLDAVKQQSSSQQSAQRSAARVQDAYNKSVKDTDGNFKKLKATTGALIKEFASGGDRVSDFSAHILGAGSGLQKLVEYADDAVDQFRSLSAVGAGFNNSIFDMMATASTAGMRLDEFYNVVQSNSETLRLLGGTVTNGAKAFSDLSKGVRSGDLGSRLFDLGFTISDVNDGMLTYINNQALQGRLERMSQQELIEGSRNYLTEIDALAKATGLSREALMNQTNDLQNNAAFQSLQARAQAGAGDALTRNMAVVSQFMPQFTDDLIQISRGTGGLTDLGKALQQVEGGGAFIDLMQRADELEPDEFLRQMSALGPGIADQIRSQFSPEQMRLLAGTPLGALFDSLTGFQRLGQIDVDAMLAEQEAASSVTSMLAGFSDSLRRVKADVLDAIINSEFGTAVTNLGTSFSNFFAEMFGDSEAGTSGVAGSLSGAFQSLTDALVGPDGYLTKITNGISGELDSFRTAMAEGKDPMDYLRERAGELGTQLKNWFLDMFLGPINDEMGMSRSGGLLGTIKAGFNSIFEEGGFADTISAGFTNIMTLAKDSFVNLFKEESTLTAIQDAVKNAFSSAVAGISNFWNDPANQTHIDNFFNNMTSFFQRLLASIRESVTTMLAPSTEEVSGGEFGATGAAAAVGGEGSVAGAAINALTGFGTIDRDQFLKEAEGGIIQGLNAWIGDALGMGMDDWFDGHINDLMAGGVDKETAKATIAEGLRSYIADNYSGDELNTMTGYLNNTLLPNLQARRIGTLRATGRPFEPESTVTRVNQGERVLNSSETGAINDLPKAMEQLNTLTAQIRDLMTQSVAHQERTARGIRKLGSDVMGAA